MAIATSFLRGETLIQASFHRGTGSDHGPTILLLQGSPGNPNDVLGLGERFAECGYNTLTFNYSGTHNSEGLSSFANAQLDIAAACQFLRDPGRPGAHIGQLIVGGWSYGGGMALTYAANHADVSAVFSIAGTDHGEFMREYTRDAMYRHMVDAIFEEAARSDSPWRLAPGATPKEALESGTSVDDYDLQKSASDLVDKDVLIVGGWDDLNVKIENHLLPFYRILRSQGSDRVTILTFQDDHSFGSVRDELATSIVNWISTLDHHDL